jgi:DUF1680 family protein
VYCLEGVDNGGALDELALPRSATLEARFEPDLLGGVMTIRGEALRLVHKGPALRSDNTNLYEAEPPVYTNVSFKAVPYFTWDNRQEGDMAVWIREV